MGDKGFALVSMTNGDVYYVSIKDAKDMQRLLGNPSQPTFLETVDIKSGAYISIALNHISSVVVKEANHA